MTPDYYNLAGKQTFLLAALKTNSITNQTEPDEGPTQRID
jgi:hypothetical protein